MNIEDFQAGSKVISIEEDYKGLIGYIDYKLTEEDKAIETGNEDEHQFAVDFEEIGDEEEMKRYYPHLNGTSVSGVIMTIDQIAILQDEETAIDFLGNVYQVKDLIQKK